MRKVQAAGGRSSSCGQPTQRRSAFMVQEDLPKSDLGTSLALTIRHGRCTLMCSDVKGIPPPLTTTEGLCL
jgi:hypothetical protein